MSASSLCVNGRTDILATDVLLREGVFLGIPPLRVVPSVVFGSTIYGLVGLVPTVPAFWKFMLTLVLFQPDDGGHMHHSAAVNCVCEGEHRKLGQDARHAVQVSLRSKSDDC